MMMENMQTITESSLRALCALLAVPVFLVRDGVVCALNPEAEALGAAGELLPGCLPEDGQSAVLPRRPLPDCAGALRGGSVTGKKISLSGSPCWLLEVIPPETRNGLHNVYRLATARKIMLDISSQIDQLDTMQNIYDFILDNCGRAVEHSGLCSLMTVEDGKVRIVAKRGFPDDVRQYSFDVHDTFLSLETNGLMNRIVRINNLDKFSSKYHLEIKTLQNGAYLRSTLSAPIYVNHALYAILNFDSTQENAFTRQDEELLYVVKTNIEIILANHRMHEEILRLSRTDMLTGLNNRTHFAESMKNRVNSLFYLGMFDMNDLKQLNDRYGHHCGDQALHCFALQLKQSFPANSSFFRMGGDEFLCVVYEMEQAEIDRRIEALRQFFRDNPLVLPDAVPYVLSFSCGFAWHEAGAAIADVVQQADHAMYAEKRRFKSCRCERR